MNMYAPPGKVGWVKELHEDDWKAIIFGAEFSGEFLKQLATMSTEWVGPYYLRRVHKPEEKGFDRIEIRKD